MREQFRNFQVPDPFGRTWAVEFRWLQNAISIRHSDTIDLKYYLSNEDGKREMVLALPHAELLALARERGRELTDAWCLRLAGLHLEEMIAAGRDLDKTIVTLSERDLARHNETIERDVAAARELAARTR